MKNSKHTKIALLLLSLVLAVGSLLGITAMAEDSGDGAVDILAYNVVYGDRVQLAFAVDTDVSEAASVEVVYYMEDPVANPEATAYKATLIDTTVKENVYTYEKEGVTYTCPVYVTAGIPVKDIGDVVYAEAHTVGATVDAPAYVSYSVAEYLYARLYKDGFANKTEADGDDFDRKELYEQFLLYAAKAQTVLVNNKLEDGAEPETLVTDYVAVYAEKATLNGGDSFLLSKGETEVTLTYTGSGTKTAWSITTYGENGETTTSTFTDNTLTISGCSVITPIELDFEIASPSIVETFEESYDNIINIAILNQNGSETGKLNCPTFGDYVRTTFSSSHYNTTGETVARLVEYVTESGTTSKALEMYSPGRIGSSYDRAFGLEAKIMESVVPEDEINAVALEFDLKLGLTIPEGSVATNVTPSPLQVIFRNYPGDGSQTSNSSYIQFTASVDRNTNVLTIGNFEIPNIVEFVRIKLVVDIEDQIVHIYANNVKLGSTIMKLGTNEVNTGSVGAWTTFENYGIPVASINGYNSSGLCDIFVDNLSFYNTYSLD